MKWLKERDELIAQTEAFVKSVTARRPEVATAFSPVRAAPIENPFAPTVARPVMGDAAPNPSTKPTPIENAASLQPAPRVDPLEALPPVKLPSEALPQVEPSPIRAFEQGEVRSEIQDRVAAFRANQHRFQREREAYYNSVLTKARSTAPDASDTRGS